MNEMSAFRSSAGKMRSSERVFDGDFVSFKHEVGAWLAGKAKTNLSGCRLVTDVHDLIVGWQKYRDDKFVYVGHGFVRDDHQPPARELLDEYPLAAGERDPWALTYYLPLFDPETHEQFIYTTSSTGGKDALAVLQEAFADHNETLAQRELPVAQLAHDSYLNQYKKKIFKPIFDIVGWCEMPPAFRVPKLPPSAALPSIEHHSDEVMHKPDKVMRDPDDGIPF